MKLAVAKRMFYCYNVIFFNSSTLRKQMKKVGTVHTKKIYSHWNLDDEEKNKENYFAKYCSPSFE